jgi:hypothetical protein
LVKRKQSFPQAKTNTRKPRGAGLVGAVAEMVRPTVARIDLTALEGRTDIVVGDRVLIAGGGLHSGEEATVESISRGLIPAMVVRTDGGKTRRVRIVDLSPLGQRGTTD